MFLRLLSDHMGNPRTFLRLGSLCMVLGIAPRLFLPSNWHPIVVHGVAGMFLGMSLVLNLRYAVLARRHQRNRTGPGAVQSR
jgi:hypothetical protein